MIALLTLDVAASKDEKALREAWRRMLAGANLLQFIPCAIALTAGARPAGSTSKPDGPGCIRHPAPP